MSVKTTADEKLASAKQYIDSAIKDLTEIYINECEGHDKFSDEYRAKIEQSFSKLLAIKKSLNS